MTPLRWSELDEPRRRALLQRPAQQRQPELLAEVSRLIEQVRADGDSTLSALTRRFDGVEVADLEVSEAEFDAAEAGLSLQLRSAIDEAYGRIRNFHLASVAQPVRVETAPGVVCERIPRAIGAVGLYVPAGSAPLPSTALMLGVPAQIAGCEAVILCSPPQAHGGVEPSVLYAARRCGIRRVFKLGGAQAIAAMAYGSESVPRCDKLFGPGNSWVTAAKLAVSTDPDGAAIDMPAGPSELLVIADESAVPAYVAADLLSQAEHGSDSQVLLLTTRDDIAEQVRIEIEKQLPALPRAATAAAALGNSRVLIVDDLTQALAISNRYAPEHLILSIRDARTWLREVRSAGSVFLGNQAPESIGDYCSGTNHVLPTYGLARAYSGVSVQSFQTFITVQELSAAGLAGIGPCAVVLAEAEGLRAHARAVSIRLEALS